MNRFTVFATLYITALFFLMTVAKDVSNHLGHTIAVAMVLAILSMLISSVFLWVGHWILGTMGDIATVAVTVLGAIIAFGFYKQIWQTVVPLIANI